MREMTIRKQSSSLSSFPGGLLLTLQATRQLVQFEINVYKQQYQKYQTPSQLTTLADSSIATPLQASAKSNLVQTESCSVATPSQSYNEHQDPFAR
jgi:hypothetical protein